jgi:protein-S-isoprenylcysteine O-methyltransferase Ste14
MMIANWMILATMAVLFFLISVKLMLRSLFKTRALQWAKHRKSVYKAEALWVWRVLFVLTIAIGVAEYVKRGMTLTALSTGTLAYAGFALLALGLIVWLAAMNARKQYLWYLQVLAPKEELPAYSVNGIYGAIRNPRELGLLLALAGIAGVFGLQFTLIFVVLLLLPATAFRANSRDRVLLEKYGKPYIDYMRLSKKLIPYIY